MILSAKLQLESSIIVSFHSKSLQRHQPTATPVGQTPRKLFTAPHPERFHHGLVTLPIGTLHGNEEDPHLLIQAPHTLFRRLGFALFTLRMLLIILVRNILGQPSLYESWSWILSQNGWSHVQKVCSVFRSTHKSRSNGDQEVRSCVLF